MSNTWIWSSKLCFSKKLPQCFHWRNSAMNMGKRITGPAVKNHISSEMAREMIAINQTMYHLWFLESQRVLTQLHFHLPRHHLHHRCQHRPTVIQYRKTEMLRIQYPKGIEVWIACFYRNRKTTFKLGIPKKYEDVSHELLDWLHEFRVDLVDESTSVERRWNPEQGSRDTSKSSVMNFQWSREHKWNRVRVNTVKCALAVGSELGISAWRRK